MQWTTLAELNERDLIVTPNLRSAREWTRAYAARAIANGQVAWRAPMIIPDVTWLNTLWTQLQVAMAETQTLPRMLTSGQERALWRSVLEKSANERGIAVNESLVRAAMRAWQLEHAWQCPEALFASGDSREQQAYHAWRRAFKATLNANHWITSAEIAPRVSVLFRHDRALVRTVITAERIVTLPVVQSEPTFEELLLAISDAGIALAELRLGEFASTITRYEFQTEREEWIAAAQWARAEQVRNPRARIVIVVPQLHSVRHLVRRIFRDTFAHDSLSNPFADTGDAFDLSLGVRLNDIPFVASALAWLRVSRNRLSCDDARVALNAPFLRAPISQWVREALEFGRTHVSTRELAQLAGSGSHVSDWIECVTQWPRRARPSQWSAHFAAALNVLGFPGEVLESESYQAVEALNQELHALAALDGILGEVSHAAALDALVVACQNHDFQSEGRSAPVQIVGELESLGFRCDAMWVCGLSELHLPEAAAPDPFLPLTWQQKARVGKIDARAMAASAQAMWAQWRTAADTLVVSHAMDVDQSSALASALTVDIAASPKPICDRKEIRAAAMEAIADTVGVPLDTPHVPRGTHALEAQAKCPFQGYAVVRLATVPWPSSSIGITPRERGEMVHEVLRRLWLTVRTQRAWLDASNDERAQLIAQHVDDAIQNFTRQQYGARATALRGWPLYLLETLRTNLIETLHEWMTLELQRPSFEVIATEARHVLRLGARELTLRIDRIDQVDSGQIVVIDYKTGASKRSVDKLKDERVRYEPQLPCYALALHAGQRVDAVVWGRVHRHKVAIDGLANADILPINKKNVIDPVEWAQRLAEWEIALTAVAEDIGAGLANVAPAQAAECRTCARHALCRIDVVSEADNE